ncbi:MAG: DUF1573 domain-containing protein [Chthonomonas sp.]|nr:DUF1573 domain-containing protein [Chthonomonas sp.]
MIALALALVQTQVSPTLGPLLPVGSHAEFQRAAIQTQRQLSAGDFAGAAKTVALLPSPSITLAVDWKNLPADTRPAGQKALADALKHCGERFPEVKFRTVAAKPNILITFSTDLGRDPDSREPKIVAQLFGMDATQPRLETVLRTTRSDKSPLDGISIYNEVLFAVGTYLGVAEESQVQGATSRASGFNQIRHQFFGPGRSVANRNLVVASQLRGYVAKRTRVIPAVPELAIEPKVQQLGNTIQGTIVPGSITVTNNGNVDLQINIVPDCGCFKFSYNNTIKPGQTEIARFTADSTAFAGKFRKKLLLVTNDPERPAVTVPVEMDIEPVYRFLRPNGAPVELVPDNGLVQDVFLAFGKGSQFKIKSVEVAGATAQVSDQEWRGSMADPEIGEPIREREGYRLTLLISPSIPTGRAPLSLIVETDHPTFGTLTYTFQVQKGIVALPQAVFFGEVSLPRTMPFTVSRPGKPFRIKSISSDNKAVTVPAAPTSAATEFALSAKIVPGKTPGTVNGVITVVTDDPKQPKILVPYTAFVP